MDGEEKKRREEKIVREVEKEVEEEEWGRVIE